MSYFEYTNLATSFGDMAATFTDANHACVSTDDLPGIVLNAVRYVGRLHFYRTEAGEWTCPDISLRSFSRSANFRPMTDAALRRVRTHLVPEVADLLQAKAQGTMISVDAERSAADREVAQAQRAMDNANEALREAQQAMERAQARRSSAIAAQATAAIRRANRSSLPVEG